MPDKNYPWTETRGIGRYGERKKRDITFSAGNF